MNSSYLDAESDLKGKRNRSSMQGLKRLLRKTCAEYQNLPFSVYSSLTEQHILNVPIVKPLFIYVLDGKKELGDGKEAVCHKGEFIFLANTPQVDMRNISQGSEYFALIIEFDYQDFNLFTQVPKESRKYFKGQVNQVLAQTLTQFVEWAPEVPQSMWSLRRQELLQLLYHQGFEQICSIAAAPSITHKVEQIINANIQSDIGVEFVAERLAMSGSTLRRKLSLENTSFQSIKDRIKLGYGLHLLQCSSTAIGLIAAQCGYQSQSRFTDKFKALFGLTPSELRKTRSGNLSDMGE